MTTFNEEVLKKDFQDAGFPVREISWKIPNILRLDYNYPEEEKYAITAMRVAMGLAGAEVQTIYNVTSHPVRIGDIASRERVLIPYTDRDELVKFFSDVVVSYLKIMDERGAGAPESAYRPQARVRKGLH